MLVVNKKSMKNHSLAVVVLMCAVKKVEAVKEEGIRAWGKHFYVLAPCRVDFMLDFYWLVSKRGSHQQTHCAMIMLNFWHCQKIIASYLWLQDHDNDHLWTSLTVRHRTTNLKLRSQKLPWLFHNADLSYGSAKNRAVCPRLKLFSNVINILAPFAD